MKVLIGVDPHKASLAVAALEEASGELLARASFPQDRTGSRALVRPRVRLLTGDGARVLSEVAEEGGGTGLLVVGSRGLGAGGRMLMGSVSTKVLMAARGPVLVCPREESDEGNQRA